jgi:hypothetical protein
MQIEDPDRDVIRFGSVPETDHITRALSGAKRRKAMLENTAIRMEFPADANIIVGQEHFIKTVEDLYEAVATTVPLAK